MKTQDEIITMSITALQKEIESATRDLFKIRMAIISQQEKDNSKQKKAKKYVARLKTERRKKESLLS